jgi:hypothetical protein
VPRRAIVGAELNARSRKLKNVVERLTALVQVRFSPELSPL